jgi:hypothetical protein
MENETSTNYENGNDANRMLSTALTERQIIEALWQLLDNIDTLSDICKPTVNDPKAAMAFYNNAMRYAGERFKYMQSDGYKIYTQEEFDKLPKPKEETVYKSINNNPINGGS